MLWVNCSSWHHCTQHRLWGCKKVSNIFQSSRVIPMAEQHVFRNLTLVGVLLVTLWFVCVSECVCKLLIEGCHGSQSFSMQFQQCLWSKVKPSIHRTLGRNYLESHYLVSCRKALKQILVLRRVSFSCHVRESSLASHREYTDKKKNTEHHTRKYKS